MSEEIVKTFLNKERTRKVVIFRRADGSFGFEEFKFVDEEQSWFPGRCYRVSFTATRDDAIREARGCVARAFEVEENA